jgi:hypothetical protein
MQVIEAKRSQGASSEVVRGSPPLLVPAFEDGMARLRGTVALVLQKHFSF